MKYKRMHKKRHIGQMTPVAAAMALMLFLAGCGLNNAQTAIPTADAQSAAAGNNQEIDLHEPRVAIYIGDQLYEMVPFDEPRVITVDQENGRVNEITFDEAGVHMSRSTCANQSCVKQGEITLENHEARALNNWIICLPNQVTIEFIAGEKE